MSKNPDLEPLITSQADFDACVLHLCKSDAAETPRLELLHLKFSEENPRDSIFAKVLANQIVNFAIPKSKIKKIMEQCSSGDFSEMSKLNAEAMSLLIKYQTEETYQKKVKSNQSKGKKTQQKNLRYTEFGELASFCIANLYLQSGQIVSKMTLKTAAGMPVFGYDGVHARMTDSGEFELIILESKVTGKAKGGADQYAQSMAKFESDDATESNELRLAHDLGNLDVLDGEAKAQALEYLDPYSVAQSNVRKRLVGTIIYSEESYKSTLPPNDATSTEEHQKHFSDQLRLKRDALSSELKKALDSSKIAHGKCRVFYLAVPCVETLKNLFAKVITHDHIR